MIRYSYTEKETKAILDSLTIIVDTREKLNQHVMDYFKAKKIPHAIRTMKTGDYRFIIHLLPRFTGKYILNPAQVSLMYIPVVNANNDMKLVEVNDEK